jgi:hypothetical protein
MSRAEALARGYKDTMSDCPFGQDCQLAGNVRNNCRVVLLQSTVEFTAHNKLLLQTMTAHMSRLGPLMMLLDTTNEVIS